MLLERPTLAPVGAVSVRTKLLTVRMNVHPVDQREGDAVAGPDQVDVPDMGVMVLYSLDQFVVDVSINGRNKVRNAVPRFNRGG